MGKLPATATPNDSEYTLRYDSTADRFAWFVSRNTSGIWTNPIANNFGALSVGVWYHIVAWYDSGSSLCGIAINDGTPNTASTTGLGPGNETCGFAIGRPGDYTGNYFDGVIDEVGFWKRALTPAERTELYNSGNGKTYPFT
jgi:hypothetical protein